MYKYIVGIDIGSSKICASVGRINDEGNVSIIGTTMTPCKGVRKGNIVNIDDTAKAIEKCIFSLEKIVEFKIREAYISIGAGMCSLVSNKGVIAIGPESNGINANDINRVLQIAKLITIDEDKQIIECIPSQFIVDTAAGIKNPIGMSGVELQVEAQIIMTQKTLMQNFIKSVNKAGIKVLGVMIQSMCLKSSVLEQSELESGVAVVDVGYDIINISIFKNDLLDKTILVPLGGNNITKDLSICLKISYEDAEKLKRQYAEVSNNNIENNEIIKLPMPNGEEKNLILIEIIQIISARVEEIFSFIKYYIKEKINYDDINSIVLVGGGICFIKNIQAFSEEILEKKVRIGVPQLIGTVSPLYANSVGIVLDAAANIKFDNNYTNNENSTNLKSQSTQKKQYESSNEDVDINNLLQQGLSSSDADEYDFDDTLGDFVIDDDEGENKLSFKDKMKSFFADFF